MFTGIIQAVGEIGRVEARGGDSRLQVKTGGLDLTDVSLGDSIATNGVCLTVVKLLPDGFIADVSNETLEFSTLRTITVGQKVNLEKALTLSTPLGGHLVSGHVDGVGIIVKRHTEARSIRYTVEAPAELAKYIAHKGSISVDGASLTVNRVDGCQFDLNIVPHTQGETIFDLYSAGSKVNLEVDLIARYLERLLLGDKAAEGSSAAPGVTLSLLAEHGFLR